MRRIGKVARPAGLEPTTPSLEGWCSIRLSYGHVGRGGEIRTPDILLPKQARYQAALHPGGAKLYRRCGGGSMEVRCKTAPYSVFSARLQPLCFFANKAQFSRHTSYMAAEFRTHFKLDAPKKGEPYI